MSEEKKKNILILSNLSDRYDIIKEIAQGEIGNIYLAQDLITGRKVAIKELLEKYSSDLEIHKKFIEEVQIKSTKLSYSSIPPIYEVFQDNLGKLYYSMKYVEGVSLKEILYKIRVENDKTFSFNHLLRIFQYICMGIYYAHLNGILHKNLKPENIIVENNDNIFIVNWGLSTSFLKIEVTPENKRYIAPEVISNNYSSMDMKSNIYSLGVILYDILVCDKNYDLSFVSPHSPLPDHTPLLLENTFRKAVNPDSRHNSAKEIYDEIEEFLNGTKEVEENKKKAKELVIVGDNWKEKYFNFRNQFNIRSQIAEELKKQYKGYESIQEKRKLWQVEDNASKLGEETSYTFNMAIDTYMRAIEYDPSNEDAQEGLAKLYLSKFTEREAEGDKRDLNYYRRLIERYDKKREYVSYLSGEGKLFLSTYPSGASLYLYEYEMKDRVLVLSDKFKDLGLSPIENYKIKMGSYMIIIRKEGYRDTRLPIYIERNGEVNAKIPLYKNEEIGENFIYIPPGDFYLGSKEESSNIYKFRKIYLNGFAISKFPVTVREYLHFINELYKARGEKEALSRVPRDNSNNIKYFKLDSGRFILPEADDEGIKWHLDWPVLGISLDDARVYSRWLSVKTGDNFSIPTEYEWEKSARGADKRIYPWGDYFDPTFCKGPRSREADPQPEVVGAFPKDESPYGVRDMAGGVSEWCEITSPKIKEKGVLKGGSWWSADWRFCISSRTTFLPYNIASTTAGFRLVKELELK